MSAHKIQSKALAKELGVSPQRVAQLRRSRMPGLDGKELNGLILGLNRLRKAESKLITLTDVIEFSLTPDEMSKVGISI